jgi:hypothetical protein
MFGKGVTIFLKRQPEKTLNLRRDNNKSYTKFFVFFKTIINTMNGFRSHLGKERYLSTTKTRRTGHYEQIDTSG